MAMAFSRPCMVYKRPYISMISAAQAGASPPSRHKAPASAASASAMPSTTVRALPARGTRPAHSGCSRMPARFPAAMTAPAAAEE